jgi:Domain of unknown function (DUF397)
VVWEERFNPDGPQERPLLPSSILGTTPNRDDQLDDVAALMAIGVPPDLTPAPAGKQRRLGLATPPRRTWAVGRTTPKEHHMSESSWEKSFASEPNGGSCVEVNLGQDEIAVRDTKLGELSPVLRYTRAEWEAHLLAVKSGQYDLGGSDRVAMIANVIGTLSDIEMLELSNAIKARTMELLLDR